MVTELVSPTLPTFSLSYQYAYANGMRIAQLKVVGYGGEKDTVYLHSDYQGSARLTTSRPQAILSRTDYDAWGQVRQQTGTPSAYTTPVRSGMTKAR